MILKEVHLRTLVILLTIQYPSNCRGKFALSDRKRGNKTAPKDSEEIPGGHRTSGAYS